MIMKKKKKVKKNEIKRLKRKERNSLILLFIKIGE